MLSSRQQVPASDKQGGNQRPDNESVDTVDLHAAQRGDKDQVVRHFGILAHQQRTQNVIHQANHNHKEADDKGALPQLPGGEEVNRRRHPDNGRAYRRDKRQERHQRTPQNAAVQTGNPEGKAAQRPLRQRHGHGAFYRGAGDRGEFSEQVLLHIAR